MTGPIQFIDLTTQQQRIREEVDGRIRAVLDHGRYIMGPEVVELEERLAEIAGVSDVISCASGTDALVLGLLALDLQPGQAVIMPGFTFVATAEAVAILGGVPVFADIDPDTYLIDPQSVVAAIETARSDGLTVAGIIAVDLFGQPADYVALSSVAEMHGIWLFADAAQSFGGSNNGTAVGALAAISATSFFPAKPLGCYGDGGAIFLIEPSLAPSLRSLRVHGQGRDKYDNVRIGINGRLDTVQAAILLAKLTIFDEELQLRAEVASRYVDGLRDHVKVPFVAAQAVSAWAQFTIEIPNRTEVVLALTKRGIPTAVYYSTPLHQQTAYRHFPVANGQLKHSDRAATRVLSLPMHPYLSTADQDMIIRAVQEAVSRP